MRRATRNYLLGIKPIKNYREISMSAGGTCCNIDSYGEICVKCGLCMKTERETKNGEKIVFLKAKKYLHSLS